MQAMLLKQYMNLEIVEMPEPEIGPDDVLVRVARAASAAATCTDSTEARDGAFRRW